VCIMTCREFKRTAASLTLWELSRLRDEQVLHHADQCAKCGEWLDKQQMLAASMQTLQARTVGREAGPHVERALLRMFRQVPFEATQPVVAHRSAPIAWRLSRFFEVGAYAAVAAAIVVGLFLGVRLMEQRSANGGVQPAPAVVARAEQTLASGNAARKEIASTNEPPATSARREPAVHPVSQSGRAKQSSPAAASPSGDDPEAEYVALMFCDPLSCSGDAQVVRLELPPTAGTNDHDAQPLVADVVVGYDGVVRAMRVVN
jgi:hypothetical protein